jgi:hypothetical protein
MLPLLLPQVAHLCKLPQGGTRQVQLLRCWQLGLIQPLKTLTGTTR